MASRHSPVPQPHTHLTHLSCLWWLPSLFSPFAAPYSHRHKQSSSQGCIPRPELLVESGTSSCRCVISSFQSRPRAVMVSTRPHPAPRTLTCLASPAFLVPDTKVLCTFWILLLYPLSLSLFLGSSVFMHGPQRCSARTLTLAGRKLPGTASFSHGTQVTVIVPYGLWRFFSVHVGISLLSCIC